MSRKVVAIVNYGGLSYGGAHRQAIRLGIALDKKKFKIFYLWCQPSYELENKISFPELNLDCLEELKQGGVHPVEFSVKKRDLNHPIHPWKGSNFFEVLNSLKVDLVIGIVSGKDEYPFCIIKKPMILWNVFGEFSDNPLAYKVAQSEWVLRELQKHTSNKIPLIYPPISLEIETKNLRERLSIPKDSFVIGFHQRDDSNLASTDAVEAFRKLNDKFKDSFLIILGGGHIYNDYICKFGKKNILKLPIASDYKTVSEFLNTLDVFVHNGKSGETLGIVVQEAMVHGLPILIRRRSGLPDAHISMAGEAALVSNSNEELVNHLELLHNDNPKRLVLGSKARERAKNLFSQDETTKRFEQLIEQVLTFKMNYSLKHITFFFKILLKLNLQANSIHKISKLISYLRR